MNELRDNQINMQECKNIVIGYFNKSNKLNKTLRQLSFIDYNLYRSHTSLMRLLPTLIQNTSLKTPTNFNPKKQCIA
jgi:hypothetical protein